MSGRSPISSGPSSGLWAVVLLITITVSLQQIAALLPHLLVPIAVLTATFVVVRLVWFYTRQW
jgi:hypothetical protein